MNTSPIAPAPEAAPEPEAFRLLRCGACRRWIHPAEGDCVDHPGQCALEETSGAGSVCSFTVNHHAYLPDIDLPYVIAMIDLDAPAELRVTARLVTEDATAVSVGTRVRAAAGCDGIRVPTFGVTD